MPTPADIHAAAVRQGIRKQRRRIEDRLDAAGAPRTIEVTKERRASVRGKGYKGPMTRAELAATVADDDTTEDVA